MILLFFMACHPFDYSDKWTETRRVCDFQESTFVPEVAGRFYPSEECVDRVLSDFSVDVDGFLLLDELQDPYDAVDGESPLDKKRLGILLATARALLTLDYGKTADLEADDVISMDYVETMRRVEKDGGTEELAASLYNFSTTVIAETIASEDGGRMSFVSAERRLRIRGHIKDGFVPGAVLVHEPRHYWVSHIQCAHNEEKSCDHKTSGAHGYGLNTLIRLRANTEDETAIDNLDRRICAQLGMIEELLDAEGNLLPEFTVYGQTDCS